MQNLHGLFAWFWVQYIGEFRGGGAVPPFIFRPNLSLQGGLTKIIFDGEGGSLSILWVWMTDTPLTWWSESATAVDWASGASALFNSCY